jgi:hypothetical protein
VLLHAFSPFIVIIRRPTLRAVFLLENGHRFSHYFMYLSGMPDYGDVFTSVFTALYRLQSFSAVYGAVFLELGEFVLN